VVWQPLDHTFCRTETGNSFITCTLTKYIELVGTSKHQHRTVKFLTQQQKSLSSLLSIIHFTYREEWNTKTLYSIPARSSVPGPPSIPWRSDSNERCNNRAPPQDTRHHRHRDVSGALRIPTLPTGSASFSPAVVDGSEQATSKRGRQLQPTHAGAIVPGTSSTPDRHLVGKRIGSRCQRFSFRHA
jgi:hypothetical protein